MNVQFSGNSKKSQDLDLLVTYGNFYKNQTILKVTEAVQDLNLIVEVSKYPNMSTKITFKNVNEKIQWTAKQAIYAKKYFLALPEFKSSNSKDELCVSINLKPDDENHFYVNLIEIANSHEDPIGFLIDHQFYWSFRSDQAIALLSKLENLEKPRVMETLEEVLKGNDDNFNTKFQAILGAGRALTIPDLKEKAKSILLHLALFDNYKCTSYFSLREIAWQQLKPLIDESDVKALFENIAKDDPRIPFRFEALNYLDKIDHYKEKLNVEILKHIISTFNMGDLSLGDGMMLDYILWINQPHSYEALKGIGEEAVARSLLKQFLDMDTQIPAINITGFRGLTPLGGWSGSVSTTAHFYSLLKFIGVHTTNQTLFSDIVHALIKVAHGHDLGTLEPLCEVLAHLRDNSSVQMPDLENIEIKHSVLLDKPKTAFGIISREKDDKQYKPKKIPALISIILSEEADVSLRKVAIRSCGRYLFTMNEYGWVQKEYEVYASVSLF